MVLLQFVETCQVFSVLFNSFRVLTSLFFRLVYFAFMTDSQD